MHRKFSKTKKKEEEELEDRLFDTETLRLIYMLNPNV